MSKEAMKLVLEALEAATRYGAGGFEDAKDALREALAKPDFWEGYVPEPDKRQQALDKKAENARELGLDYEPVWNNLPSNKDVEDAMRLKRLSRLAEQPAQQEPVDFASLLREAEELVREKPTWKRFIEGTPLSNDIAVWMTVFAQDVARRTSPPAQRTWVGLTDEDIGMCLDVGDGSMSKIIQAIEAKLKGKNGIKENT